MAEDQESPPSVIENLALVTDAIQTMFPDGKIICVYELNDQDFKKVQENFRKIDNQHKRFSIDMSGLEHVFIHEDINLTLLTPDINYVDKKPNNKSFLFKIKTKISSWFKSGGSSIK